MLSAPHFFYVFGLGKSGQSAVRYFQNQGLSVKAWDDSPETRKIIDAHLLQDPATINWAMVEKIILSPGIPHEGMHAHPVLLSAKDHGIPIVVDIEIFLERLLSNPNHTVIGITGTNGKSTTTSLLCHVLQCFGKKAIAAGNIGIPVLDLPSTEEETYYILELSSYQLTLLKTHRLDLAVLLNITPDHLAYHGNMESYVKTKESIFSFLRPEKEDQGIVIIDDSYTQSIYKKYAHLKPVSTDPQKPTFSLKLQPLEQLQGNHNAQNILACYAALQMLIPEQIEDALFLDALKTFKALPHRQEVVLKTSHILFINDSKATNMDAAEKSLKTFQNIHWILGGQAKSGESPISLRHLFSHITHVYLVGSSLETFAKDLEGVLPYTLSKTVEQATKDAFQKAKKGDVILLAPACASFDQFKNFEERGNFFKTYAKKIAGLSDD